MKEVKARDLRPGMLYLMPFNKTATVAAVRVGPRVTVIRWVEDYPQTKVESDHPFLVEEYKLSIDIASKLANVYPFEQAVTPAEQAMLDLLSTGQAVIDNGIVTATVTIHNEEGEHDE